MHINAQGAWDFRLGGWRGFPRDTSALVKVQPETWKLLSVVETGNVMHGIVHRKNKQTNLKRRPGVGVGPRD